MCQAQLRKATCRAVDTIGHMVKMMNHNSQSWDASTLCGSFEGASKAFVVQ